MIPLHHMGERSRVSAGSSGRTANPPIQGFLLDTLGLNRGTICADVRTPKCLEGSAGIVLCASKIEEQSSSSGHEEPSTSWLVRGLHWRL